MATLNDNFLKLQKNYLFVEIAQRVAKYKEAHPDAPIIRLGIGDVTRPLAPAVIEALHKAVDEQASSETFRGYGPEQGYEFLRRAISDKFVERFLQGSAVGDAGLFNQFLAGYSRFARGQRGDDFKMRGGIVEE